MCTPLFSVCSRVGSIGLLIMLAAVPGVAAAQELDAGGPLTVANAAVHSLRATGSGREFQISIYRPTQPATPAGYPVIYVLDANAMLLTVIEAVRAHDRRLDRGHADPVVIVGIGYPPSLKPGQERVYDLTPPATADPRIKQPTGGADALLDFIEQDLKPAIAAIVPVDTQRQTLLGHSLAGQFTLYSLLTRPHLFDTYLAASPSLWYGEGYLLKRLPEVANAWKPGQRPKRLLLTVGQYEQELHPALQQHPQAKMVADRLSDMRQLENVRLAASRLQNIPGLLLQFQEIANEDHGSVVPAALGRAVFFTLVGPFAPPVPAAQQYWEMTPKQRYELRLWVRDLADAQRIPWLTQLRDNLHKDLTAEQVAALHAERNQMDKIHGTRPHAVNAPDAR